MNNSTDLIKSLVDKNKTGNTPPSITIMTPEKQQEGHKQKQTKEEKTDHNNSNIGEIISQTGKKLSSLLEAPLQHNNRVSQAKRAAHCANRQRIYCGWWLFYNTIIPPATLFISWLMHQSLFTQSESYNNSINSKDILRTVYACIPTAVHTCSFFGTKCIRECCQNRAEKTAKKHNDHIIELRVGGNNIDIITYHTADKLDLIQPIQTDKRKSSHVGTLCCSFR